MPHCSQEDLPKRWDASMAPQKGSLIFSFLFFLFSYIYIAHNLWCIFLGICRLKAFKGKYQA